ncbi:uncharacterized protein LOC108911348 isoform X2 [Anoplophora glabripennis]|uniref:uncharacterized protein LOC108911348 isoform X2 n=1 Tax=Anoplophora glabripennis TaxID=217634 RepID=UPI0008750710|nr:uncharacterized protein LOC108911348 isoform X2 [Anoplophora glabripennis]
MSTCMPRNLHSSITGSRNLRKVNTKFTASNTDPNSPEYIYRHVYQNHKNPIYLVPYSALPENFDFSRSDITVRGDYIILKDLHVLEQPVIRPPSTPTTPVSASFPQIHFEGYQRQPPYNPNVY